MNSDLTRVTVRILDKEYQVACPPEEREALIESAALLHRKMQEIRKTGSVIGLDRIAVMAALNLAHESLQFKETDRFMSEDLAQRLQRLHDKIQLTLVDEPARAS